MALIFARYSAFIDKGSAKYPQFIEQEFDKAIYAFALRKIRNKTFGLPDNSLEAAEDYAIEVVEKAREHVTRIEGGA